MIRSIVTNKEELTIPSVDIHDDTLIGAVVGDMIDTATHHATTGVGCAGLAANQIGELYNIFIVWHEAKWLVFINPELELLKGQKGYMKEGCLSRPNVFTKKQRHKKIRVSYTTWPEKELQTKKYTGYTARVIQHEYDHLEGIYI